MNFLKKIEQIIKLVDKFECWQIRRKYRKEQWGA